MEDQAAGVGTDRRGFGLACAAVVAGFAGAGAASQRAVAGQASRPEPSQPDRSAYRGGGGPIRPALKIGMIAGGNSLLEKFRIARQAGFAGVELDGPFPQSQSEVIDAKGETGIEVPGLVCSAHWGKPLSHPDAAVRAECVAAMERSLRQAKAVGATSVLLVPGVVNQGIEYADAWSRSLEEIRRLLPTAEELGVSIVLENVWSNFLLSPVETVKYIDELQSPAVGMHFDIGNVVRYGWPEHWITALGDRVYKLDVKEYSRQKQNDEGLWKGFQVEIGEGDCGWPRVVSALERIGYRGGWAAAEVGGGDLARLQDVCQRMNRVLCDEFDPNRAGVASSLSVD